MWQEFVGLKAEVVHHRLQRAHRSDPYNEILARAQEVDHELVQPGPEPKLASLVKSDRSPLSDQFADPTPDNPVRLMSVGELRHQGAGEQCIKVHDVVKLGWGRRK